jgi:hypothetical protein
VSNTSATGGYLQQTSGPLEGQALERFIHGVISGVTGIQGDLVRPKWQRNPPPIPDVDVDWVGFGIQSRQHDASAYHSQLDDKSELVRHELIEIACSFYGPSCLGNIAALTDCMELTQNNEALFLAGFGFVRVESGPHFPELVNNVFFDRADCMLLLRREMVRAYPVLPLLSAEGTIAANRNEADSLTQINFSA